MLSKSKIFVLLMAVCAVAGVEDISKSSAPFSFTVAGVVQGITYFGNSTSFLCKKITNGKEAFAFSWSLPKIKDATGKLSIYGVSGKLIKSFGLSSNQGSFIWNVGRGHMADGVYFASLSYGQYNKSLRILF